MKIKHLFYLIALYFSLPGCSGPDCNNLPAQFLNYEEALQKVKAAHFLTDERDTNLPTVYTRRLGISAISNENMKLLDARLRYTGQKVLRWMVK